MNQKKIRLCVQPSVYLLKDVKSLFLYQILKAHLLSRYPYHSETMKKGFD